MVEGLQRAEFWYKSELLPSGHHALCHGSPREAERCASEIPEGRTSPRDMATAQCKDEL